MTRPTAYQVLDDEHAARLLNPQREFAFDVLCGLNERPKRLSSRYFYDDRGSELFAQIMDLPTYYLTGCEREILRAHRGDILGHLAGQRFNVVDLGAGDARKTMLLLEHLVASGADARYVPIDISEGAMRVATDSVQSQLGQLDVRGLVTEYTQGLQWLAEHDPDRRNLVLFLGSNIGNFNFSRARAFLRRLWSALRTDDLVLIGFDLKKDLEALLLAYNDPQGVTAAFNLNLLTRINRSLGGDFETSDFRHFGTYDVISGAMESYLVSKRRQQVNIRSNHQRVQFEAWEPIHMEYSYKYLSSDIEQLAEATGFAPVDRYFDERHWFVDELWRVERPDS